MTDWKARAEREAAAILSECEVSVLRSLTYDTLVTVVAAGWLQGMNYGAHESLCGVEMATERIRAEL